MDDGLSFWRGIRNAFIPSLLLWALVFLIVGCAQATDPLTAVNLSVNHRMVYVPDPPGINIWSGNCTAGDCEDFAACKLTLLKAFGYEGRIVAIWHPERKTYHAVAVVNGWVLDNLTDDILPWYPPVGGYWYIAQGARADETIVTLGGR